MTMNEKLTMIGLAYFFWNQDLSWKLRKFCFGRFVFLTECSRSSNGEDEGMLYVLFLLFFINPARLSPS